MDTIAGSSQPSATLHDGQLTAAGVPDANGSTGAPAPADGPPLADRGPGPAPAVARPVLHGAGVGLTLLGAFLLGFLAYLYLFSGIQEARAQTTMYPQLRIELGGQVAPLGATTPGNPVAILDIPGIGIKDMIVVEGTSSENTELGPGHVRNTPLPGQSGVSEILGRRATYGAPFAGLMRLRRGAKITFITGQGKSVYTVMARGDSGHLVEDPTPNRLLILTACSAYVPTTYCYLDADLVTAPQQDPGGRPGITSAETALSGDSGALVDALLWGLALTIISATATVAAIRWSPWLTYLAAAPLGLAVLWNLYQSLAALLPNVY
ncbi:MAG TPA: class E sortase [Streptosporangiaceae bacterium]|nr:class E sortase [Streptosporangiaceae bacterium]